MAELYLSPEVFATLFPVTAARRRAAEAAVSHEQQRRGRPACDFYAVGRCRKGDQCRFRHEDATRLPTATTTGDQAIGSAVPPPPPVAGPVAAAVKTPAVPATASEAPAASSTTTASDKAVPPPPPRPPEQCRFFRAGNCWRGDHCRFAHGDRLPIGKELQDKDEMKRMMMMPECPYFAKDNCRYGNNCFLQHTTQPLYETAATSPCAAAEEEEEKDEDQEAAPEVVDEEDDAAVCGICLEVPSACQPARMYGLLEGCDHCFCRECLMQWRSGVPFDGNAASTTTSDTRDDINKETKRSCPLCRVHSHLVVPSKQFMQGTAKEDYLNSLRARKSKIPCMYWKKTQRCPYHHWCLYAHRDPQGKDMKPAQKLKWEQGRQQKARRITGDFDIRDMWNAVQAAFDEESDYNNDSDLDEFDSDEWETEEEDDEDEEEDEDEDDDDDDEEEEEEED
ncbi:hypothetical protein HDU87_002450 [Geranomyces variabilis]|uniref:RING-type E3 ubiquitin transferase n=1 Tax=Geranomyces variabilis TaxID=109894 RepID=A0AAD5TMS1_9FUNG|nr:hypothetical protein HDU87_002450 [Geranomyces variabilis]